MMKIRNKFQNLLLQEDLNFLLTNRIPRITLTRFMGWWSQLRNPLIVKASIAVWRWFTDLDLSEAKQQKFASLHECFTRELRPGLRPIDPRPEILSSPCDCIVGACGEIRDGMVFQAKGFPYTLDSLLSSTDLVQHWPSVLEGGAFVTMRLTSSMYHRFHAPCDAHLSHVTYISGDTWNVNPIALNRVKELFCKNERAVLQMKTTEGVPFLIVPVAAVLVRTLPLVLHGGSGTPADQMRAAIAAGNSVYAASLTPGAVSFTNIVGADVVGTTASVDVSATSTSVMTATIRPKPVP